MPHPLLVGGLVLGGAVAGWRLIRERGRIRRMVAKLARDSANSDAEDVVPLIRDPDTGVFTPPKKR